MYSPKKYGESNQTLSLKGVVWARDCVIHQLDCLTTCVCTICQQFPAAGELPGDTSSLGDIMEESDWEMDSDLAILNSPMGTTPTKGSAQAEREIR